MTTQDLRFVILYATDPAASARFNAGLLGMPPVEQSPNFVAFALPSGVMLGLWATRDVTPPPKAEAGSSEVVFTEADVDAVHRDWQAKGVRIAAEPEDRDFGRTFVGLDPDGHRLRVLRPAA